MHAFCPIAAVIWRRGNPKALHAVVLIQNVHQLVQDRDALHRAHVTHRVIRRRHDERVQPLHTLAACSRANRTRGALNERVQHLPIKVRVGQFVAVRKHLRSHLYRVFAKCLGVVSPHRQRFQRPEIRVPEHGPGHVLAGYTVLPPKISARSCYQWPPRASQQLTRCRQSAVLECPGANPARTACLHGCTACRTRVRTRGIDHLQRATAR